MLIVRYVMNVENQVTYIWAYGIYGYSYTIYMLTTALNIVPLEWLRWSTLIASAIVSFTVIIAEIGRNLREQIKGPNVAKFAMLALFIAFSHSIFVLSLRRYFLA